MNSIFGAFIALFLPAVLGFSWLQILWPQSHLAARVGYGYLLGICFSMLTIYIWSSMGLPLSFFPLTLIMLVLTYIPMYLRRIRPQKYYIPAQKNKQAVWEHLVWILLLSSLVVRLSGLLLEEFWRPLYPWDAWINWAPKAKVWFALGDLVPFVHYFDWPRASSEIGAYTLGNPKASTYPPFIPLLQTWMALGIGEWRDTWINFPWALCTVAFFLAFYGQLRMLKISPLWCMTAAYLLFSTPYLNTHVALAGYAELWLAAFYCAAVMALLNWSQTDSRFQLLLVLLLGMACIFTKTPGMIWSATLFLGVLFKVLPAWLRYSLLGLGTGIAGFLLLNGTILIELPGNQALTISSRTIDIPGLGRYLIGYHPVGEYFGRNLFLRGNWHMLGWLVILLIPVVSIRVFRYSCLRPSMLALGTGMAFILVVFFFTGHYQAAVDSTTINRAIFHLFPALFYFTIVSTWFMLRAPISDGDLEIVESRR